MYEQVQKVGPGYQTKRFYVLKADGIMYKPIGAPSWTQK